MLKKEKNYRATLTITTAPFFATDNDNAEIQADRFIQYVRSAMDGIIGVYPLRMSIVVEELAKND